MASTDIPLWAQIVIAVFGTGGGAAALIGLIRELTKASRSKSMDQGLHDIHEIYIELQELLSKTSADRIQVLKSHNGGGLPKPGSEIRSTVVYEVFNGTLRSLRDTWQRVPLDQEYSEILSILSAGQWVWRKTERLAERSVMRDMLESEVSLVVLTRICGTTNALWYIALHFRGTAEVPEAQRVAVRQAIYRLRVLFARYQTLVKQESTAQE